MRHFKSVGAFSIPVLGGLLLLGASYGMPASAQSNAVDFHIKPQALSSALLQFSDQAHIQVVSQAPQVAKVHTSGVSGRMQPSRALTRLLSGTGLSFAEVGRDTVAIRPSGKSAGAMQQSTSSDDPKPVDPAVNVQAPADPPPAQTAGTSQTKLSSILVTGSLIKRSTALTSQPVLTISRQELQDTGLVSLGDVLQQLTSASPTMNQAFNFEANGASNIDLRYLGPKRVLVLVNGKRWATNLSGETNLNSIPMSVVKRIEVLKDGASAIYGTDAIAGVINIITINNFQGAEVSVYRGLYHGDGHWDGMTEKYTATVGSFTNHSSWVMSAEYRHNNRIAAVDRNFSSVPVYGAGVTRGSSATPQGRFIFVAPTNDNPSSPNVQPAPYTGLTSSQCPAANFGTSSNPEYLPFCDLTLAPGTDGQNPANYVPWTNYARYNWVKPNPPSRGDSLLIPTTEKSAYFAGHYDFGNGVTVVTSGLYDHGSARADAAPDLLFLSSITVPASQQYNPFGFELSGTQPVQVAPGVQRPTLSLIGRRLQEFPARANFYDRRTFRYMGGLEGSFTTGSTLWNWNTSFLYLEDQERHEETGLVDGQHLNEALSPTLCPLVTGCVQMNLFGGQGVNGSGTITPAQVKFLEYNNVSNQEQTERIYNAEITTSNLAPLPGGSLGFAAGYQLRQLQGSYTPDSISAQASILGPATFPTSGGYHVNSLFSELDLPLLAHVPWAYHLNLDAATRYSRYSTFGNKLRSRAGIKWQPIADLAIRGTWSEGFRAPNINEAFAGNYSSFPIVFDPCSNYQNSGVPQNVQQNCANAGVPTSYTQFDQQITAENGGNPNLQPETSISKTFGFIYSPSQLPNFSVQATYYHIAIDNTIQPFGAQNIMNACYLTGNQTYCADIQRNSFGHVNRIFNLETNIGSTITDGIDLGADYRWASPIGMLRFALHATHVRDYRQISPTGSGGTSVVALVGQERAGFTFPISIPSWKANLHTTWEKGHWRVSWIVHYISALREKCSDFLDNSPLSLANLGLCSNPNFSNNSLSTNRLAAVVWHDLQMTYSASNGLDYTLGVNNVLDKRPPRETQPIEDIAFDPTEYESLIGRYFYASITARF